MFNKEEILILKELVEVEIVEVDKLIKSSNSNDKEELQQHKMKLKDILIKLDEDN